MKKLFLIKNILITWCVILIVVAGNYFYYRKTNQNQLAQIESWDKYQEIVDSADKFIGAGDCGGQEFNKFKQQTVLGSMKKITLPGNLDLIITPNYDHWTNNQFLALISDSNAICAAGGRYPLKAYIDKLLWIGVCDTGVESESQCQKSAEIVNGYYAKDN